MSARRLVARVEEHVGLRTADLPRGLVWVYFVGALFATPVFSRNFFQLAPHLQLQAFVGNVLPFACVPAGIHVVYRFIVPGLLARASTPLRRILVHFVAMTMTASVVGAVLYMTIPLFGWRRAPLSGFILANVVITWAILFPSKLVLAWRGRAEKAHQAALRNELYAIQSRAHPHFLFNALNTVAALIPEDPERAEETLERFADVLRYILETSTVSATPIARDLVVLREYLEIQRTRFGDRLHYSIEVEAGLEGVLAPPLILLPLVENAVVHGIAANGKGHIVVRIRQEGGHLALDVEDDGPGPGHSPRQGTGTALRDLRRRLELLYDGEASLVTRTSVAGGHAVGLLVPLAPSRRDHRKVGGKDVFEIDI